MGRRMAKEGVDVHQTTSILNIPKHNSSLQPQRDISKQMSDGNTRQMVRKTYDGLLNFFVSIQWRVIHSIDFGDTSHKFWRVNCHVGEIQTVDIIRKARRVRCGELGTTHVATRSLKWQGIPVLKFKTLISLLASSSELNPFDWSFNLEKMSHQQDIRRTYWGRA